MNSRSSPPATVCVVDDDEAVRSSIARLLQSARYDVKSFASAQAYLDSPPEPAAHCVVLDVWMPGLSGIDLQEMVSRRGEQIIFMSGHADVPLCARAMKGGAIDFLTKPVDADLLLQAVQIAVERAFLLAARRHEHLDARKKLALLTPREFEVMQGVVAGLLNKQIADGLGAAEKTIKIHRARVMEKIGVDSVAALVRFAQSAGVSPQALNAVS